MKASILLPVYNRRDILLQCLASLKAQTLQDHEIIVINDGSTDGTEDLLKTYDKDRLIIIHIPRNMGAAYARNRGIEQCRGDIIALIDSDCVAHPRWLEELIAPFEADPSVEITTGQVSDPPPQTYWQCVNRAENFIRKDSGYVTKAVGCNMAFRREFILKHPFNETLKFSEETDLYLACLKEKKHIFYTDQAQVTHHRRSTLFSSLKQQFNWGYYNTAVRLKWRAFPYINIGTWILLGALLCIVLGIFLKERSFLNAATGLGIVYLGLVAYIGWRPKQRSVAELIIYYPGLLLRALTDCLGNICYLGSRIFRKSSY